MAKVPPVSGDYLSVSNFERKLETYRQLAQQITEQDPHNHRKALRKLAKQLGL